MTTTPPDRPSASDDTPKPEHRQEGPGPNPDADSRRDALDYTRSMLAELSAIARRERLDMLAYLIEMAYVESADLMARDAASAPHRARRPRSGGTPK